MDPADYILHRIGSDPWRLRPDRLSPVSEPRLRPIPGLGRVCAFPQRAHAVSRHAQGTRTELVGDAGGPPGAHAGDRQRLPAGAPPHVFSVLAVGVGAGLPAAKLVCRPQWNYRLRYALCIPDRTGGTVDARDLRPGLGCLCGAQLAPAAARPLTAGSVMARHAWRATSPTSVEGRRSECRRTRTG